MFIMKNVLLLQILLNGFIAIMAQYCVTFKPVLKTRIQWNNGQRLVSKKNFFGVIKYKYEPYDFTTVEHFHDYERLNVCCNGYARVDDTKCEPVCNPACPSNTHCIRPDVCECDWGYRGYTASAINIQCEAFCKPACAENAECIEPNKCMCRTGYEDVDGSGSQCQPICKKGCVEHASCTKPDLCTCNQGYFANDAGQCQPECNPKCPQFSDCTKPDTCVCHENYKAEEGQCRPICEQTCPQNAVCVRPNECECLLGYESMANSGANSSFSCHAKCVEPCPAFAACVEPNKCECLPDYRKTEQNVCEPICEAGCPPHSTCTAPNTCSCEKGYDMVEHQCQPVCEKECPEYATCTEPNKCLCANGYQLKLSSIYNLYCEPVCQNNCSSFGKCVQPNKCECLEGYEMDEYDLCHPVCSKGCVNGFCFQPDICICKPGYLMGPRAECEPVCSMACQNGSCVEPEICQCHEGYKFEANSVSICEPVCASGCINGICVAPNVCICHENFEPQQTETGLNHSNCQPIARPSSAEATSATTSSATGVEDHYEAMTATTSLSTHSHYSPPVLMTTHQAELLQHSSTKPSVSVHNCSDGCQCWQEYDELGSLTFQQCAHLCTNGSDKPCLDLNKCICDSNTQRLVCMFDEEDLVNDDPVYYTCSLSGLKLTPDRSNEESVSKDLKSPKPISESQFTWWLLLVLGSLMAICLLALVVYFYSRKPEAPILEYEL